MDRVRARIVVSGLVQGVAFRAATVDEARRLRLHGWVKNLADGRVEAEAEGERAAVEALVAWCRRGPPAAQVDDVTVTWVAHAGDLAPFAIRW
ncbi:acylphosphatase [Anaeromyxobacter oryzae]|uniref:Acylphosphatase n=1 Tax=Anaeromyxobacter oryzae TaxID=2918170 RepID=A0ABM7WY03_9BACT|nr:acylphosphatase [Anaeromyxobacter oryzae]BDG04352.1 acylphosphatase [Anaeromyxobacter oryzae]